MKNLEMIVNHENKKLKPYNYYSNPDKEEALVNGS